MGAKRQPPRSCVRWSDPLLNLAAAGGAYALCRDRAWSAAEIALAVSAAVALAMSAAEIAGAPWRSAPRPATPLRLALNRAAIKLTGAMAALCAVLLAWIALPEYGRTAYNPLFEALPIILPLAPFAVAACLLFTEWRLGPAEDSAWHLGLFATGKWEKIDWAAARDGALGWLVRGFFLPLNFCALAIFIGRFRGAEAEVFSAPWPRAHAILMLMISAALAAAIVPGYLFGARLTGTHIRKVDYSWFGWTVTMSCYPPLVYAVFGQWLNFYPPDRGAPWNMPWAAALQPTPTLAFLLGGIALAIEILHYWGEAVFGLRSSNLSHRGIITNGPYRFCKHPVYLVKCLGWFLWMPFLMGDTALDCLRLTLLWAGVCGVYMMRAWVEEKLLSPDPDYAAYALWIDRHGLFSWLGELVPALSFGWRQKRWLEAEARGG